MYHYVCRYALLLMMISLIMIIGCDDEAPSSNTEGMDESLPIADGEQRYYIPFVATVNDAPLNCGTEYEGVGSSRSKIEVRDFRFYIYDIHLVTSSGESTLLKLDEGSGFQIRYSKADGTSGGLALLDFTDTNSEACADRGTEEVNTVISGVAPEGDYQKITFTLGVPPELNHINGAVSQAPLNTYGMQWTWASGYRYVKLDVKATTGEVVKSKYYFHPGAQGCVSDNGEISGVYSCENELTSQIELDFQADYLASTQAIQADLSRLLVANDLSLGRGCMGARTISDPAVDGFGVDPTDGCPELYAAVGIRLPSVVASQPEVMGQCSQDRSLACMTDTDCMGEMCTGYQPALSAERAEAISQTLFTTVSFDQEVNGAESLSLDQLSPNNPVGWPHPDYQRNPALNTSAMSTAMMTRSHPPEDPRYGENCMKCHQEQGPGLSQFVIGGTLYDENDGVYTAGGFIEIGTGVGNRFGPKVHPIADKIKNWTMLFRLPIDAHGQFYASADEAEAIDYDQNNYFARVVGSSGQCKSQSGEVVMGEDGQAVTCEDDTACAELTYEVSGSCIDAMGAPLLMMGRPVSCSSDEMCGEEGATCDGYEAGLTPTCDKLLNAMAVSPHGACNQCHQSSFKIRSVPSL